MAASGGDGSIILKTEVDKSGIEKGMSDLKSGAGSLTDAFKKLGKAAIAAFSVKSILSFVKETRNLYKEQVQNEVRLAQTMRQSMGATDDKIKKILELTAAEQNLGIIGDEIQLAGAQELATYLDQTEALETLIPVMNDMVTQQYGFNASQESAQNIATMLGKVMEGQTGALSRYGYSFDEAQEKILKTGNEMERAAVLAEVVQSSVGGMNYALAQTDVGRQKQLANTFGDIKEQLGAAFNQIAILFLPALNAVAKALAYIAKIARMASQAIANLFSKKSVGANTQIKEQEQSISGIASAGGKASESVEDLGKATGKASKEAKKATAGFDNLQILTSNISDSAGAAAESIGDIGGTSVGTGFDFGIQEEVDTTPLEKALDSITNKLDYIKGIFMDGFWEGFGNWIDDAGKVDLSGISNSFYGIKESIKSIFGSETVNASASKFMNSIATAIGKGAGSIASAGLTIAQNLLGGIDMYLSENGPFISQRISGIFDASAGIVESVGNTWTAFANIFSVFADENGQALTGNIIGIFSDAGLGLIELSYKIGEDVINFFTKPIVDNQDKIKKALDGILGFFADITGSIKELVDDLVDGVIQLYDEHVSPWIQVVKDVVTEWVSTFVDAWNKHVQPVLDEFAEDFKVLVSEYIQPMFEKIFGFISTVIDEYLKPLWDKVLRPLGNWLINVFVNAFSNTFTNIKNDVFSAIKFISGLISSVMDICSGLIKFFTGVFTGDWSKAWEGIQDIFKGIWNGIVTFVEAGINFIISGINKFLGGLDNLVSAAGSLFGKEWNINLLEPVSLPRLAQGAVIPPNKEFLAVLGDQKQGVNIEAPLDTIVEAFNIALNQNGSSRSENIEVVLKLDERELGRAIVECGNKGKRIVGTRLVTV